MTLTSEDSGPQVPQVPQVLQVRAVARPGRETLRGSQRKGRPCPPPPVVPFAILECESGVHMFMYTTSRKLYIDTDKPPERPPSLSLITDTAHHFCSEFSLKIPIRGKQMTWQDLAGKEKCLRIVIINLV